MIQEVLWDVRPDVLIELGTNTGGGALALASIMHLIEQSTKGTPEYKRMRIITIDPRGASFACTLSSPCCTCGTVLWTTCFLLGALAAPAATLVCTPLADFHDPWFPGLSCTEEKPCKRPDTNPLWSQHVTFIQVGPTERLVRKEHTASVRAFTALHFCPDTGVRRADEPASEAEPCLPPCTQGLPTDPAILDRVRALLRQWNATTVMVSEDSSHAYQHVRC